MKFPSFSAPSLRAAASLALLVLTAPAPALEYVRSAINLPSATTAFETAYDLDGDGRSDAIAIFQRRILVFFQKPDGKFPSAPDVEIGSGRPIPSDYAAVSVGKMTADPGLQLLLIGRTGVDYLTAAQLKGQGNEPVQPRPLINSRFDLTSQPNLQFLNAAIDMDGDGKADLILPNSDQLEIYSRGANGRFSRSGTLNLPMRNVQRTSFDTEPALLGSPLFEEPNAREFVQTLPRLGDRWHAARFSVESVSDPFLVTDFTRDRRLDFLLPQNLHVQTEAGGFEPQRTQAFSRISQATAVQEGRLASVPNLVDFNGDGILDTFRVEATAAKMSPRTDLQVYLGRPDRSFPDAPDFVLRTRNIAYSELLPMGDMNGDGAMDVALLHLDFQPSSASSQLRAYMKNGLNGDLRFYLWDKERNRFSETQSYSHPILVNYDIYGARQLFRQQVAINQDMDGDHTPDLVLKTGPEEVSVFRTANGRKFGIESRPAAVIRTSPVRFSSLQTAELNGDGKGDVIVTGYLEGSEDRVIYSLFISR